MVYTKKFMRSLSRSIATEQEKRNLCIKFGAKVGQHLVTYVNCAVWFVAACLKGMGVVTVASWVPFLAQAILFIVAGYFLSWLFFSILTSVLLGTAIDLDGYYDFVMDMAGE